MIGRFLGRLAAAFILFSILGGATAPAALADSHAVRLPVDGTKLVAETQAGLRNFTVEIADDTRERSAGLMFRQEMADTHGMLFVFEDTRPVSFWMKNTPMPLDLIFIGEDGMVRDVLPGEPFSEAPIAPRGAVRFVLEVKRGIAGKNGIAVGDRIRHPAIDAVAGR